MSLLTAYAFSSTLQPQQVRQRPVHHLGGISLDNLLEHVRRLQRQALGMYPVALIAHDVAERDRRDRGSSS